MRKRKQKQAPEPEVEQDEDLAPEPEKQENPKGPNGRLKRSQTWSMRSENLMKDVEADVGNATMELIGPGAREALLRYNGGSKLAAAGEVEEAKSKAIAIAKAAKEVAKHAKEAADKAESLAWALDIHYIDLLTGQTSLDDVEEGRNRESKKGPPPKPDEAAPGAAPPGDEQPAPDAPESAAAPRRPQDVPGIDPTNLETYEGPETLRELARRMAESDRRLGARPGIFDDYVQASLDSLADLRQGQPAIELTEAERAEFRAGLAEGAGIEDRPVVTIVGPPQELLHRARELGEDHKRLTMSECTRAEAIAELLGPEAKALPPEFLATLLVSYANGYHGVAPVPAPVADQGAVPPSEAPKKRARRARGR